MKYTVKKLAKISGNSVRTLHFYDEIGLLKPAYYGDNGYRYYEEEQLLMLQQILFFRELGFQLNQIQSIICSPDFSKIEALQSHRHILLQKTERTQMLIQTIDKTIARLKGVTKMSDHEMYAGFDSAKQKEYEEYLVKRYGNSAQALIAQSKENIKNWKKDDWAKLKKESEDINRELVSAINRKYKADTSGVQSIIQRHYQMIKQFYTPTKEVYISLGQLYIEHPDFRKLYDSIHPSLGEFLAEAMKIFAERKLQ
jgi:MerR family transcriptional regulator, thiopeptide resistance regulator